MARDKVIKVLRTTRTNLDAQKNANGLLQGEPYLITDESRLAVGTAPNNYQDFAKKSECDAKKTDYVSGAAKILGRKTSGAGAIEELSLSEVMDFIGGATAGDILYRGASSWARLPKGADGQVLSLVSGVPSWVNAAGAKETLVAYRISTYAIASTSWIDIPSMSITLKAGKTYWVDLVIYATTVSGSGTVFLLGTGTFSHVCSVGAVWSGNQINTQSEDSYQYSNEATSIVSGSSFWGTNYSFLHITKAIIVVGGSDRILKLMGLVTEGSIIYIHVCNLKAQEL